MLFLLPMDLVNLAILAPEDHVPHKRGDPVQNDKEREGLEHRPSRMREQVAVVQLTVLAYTLQEPSDQQAAEPVGEKQSCGKEIRQEERSSNDEGV